MLKITLHIHFCWSVIIKRICFLVGYVNCLQGVSVQLAEGEEILRTTEEPMMLNLRPCDVGTVIPVQFYFHGHYGEPSLTIKHMVNTTFQYLMVYNPHDGKWSYQAARTL